MARQTFAIGIGRQVALWCTGTEKRFEVINGAWTGRLKDGLIYVVGRGEDKKPVGHGDLLWRGTVPREQSFDYNEAIRWIQGEVNRGKRGHEPRGSSDTPRDWLDVSR